VAIGLHIFLLLSIVKKLLFLYYDDYSDIIGNLAFAIIFPIFILTTIYYNRKRVEKIIENRKGNLVETNAINSIKILSLIFIPLILIFIFAKK